MDPNQALADLRDYVRTVLNDEHSSVAAIELAAKIDGLDHWITSGGFLPSDWASDASSGRRALQS